MIVIGRATLHWTPEGALTVYDDGAQWGALPHDTPDYQEVTARLGYPDILTYCRHHEFAHHAVSEWGFGKRSRVLWPLAHGEPVDLQNAVSEEALCHTFQKWIMLGERPIIGDFLWQELRDRALAVLG